MRLACVAVCLALGAAKPAPSLPPVFSFVQTFDFNGAEHKQTIYLDVPNQLERLDSGSSTQLNRPTDQGCTYSIYGGGAGCSSWGAVAPVGGPVITADMSCDTTETVDNVLCDKCVGFNGNPSTAWFKQNTNELVQTTDGSSDVVYHYSQWTEQVDASIFDVQPSWHCTGPSSCLAGLPVAPATTTEAPVPTPQPTTCATPCGNECCTQSQYCSSTGMMGGCVDKPVASGGSNAAPSLPDVFSFVQTFTVSGARHTQTIYLDVPNQLERLDSGSSTQLNRPKDQGCTYSIYGGGAGCSSWGSAAPVGGPVITADMSCDTTETVDNVLCDKCVGFNGNPSTAWFKQGTNELVQTTDGSSDVVYHYSQWTTQVDSTVFDVQPSWHCSGPSQCTGGAASLLMTNDMANPETDPVATKARADGKADGKSEGLLTGSLATLGAVAAVALAVVAVHRRRTGAAGTPSSSTAGGAKGHASFGSNPGLLDEEASDAAAAADAANAL